MSIMSIAILYIMSQGERWLQGAGAAERRYPTSKVRSGSWSSCEEIIHVQAQEWWLRFAGPALWRYPTSKARETPVRRSALERL